MRHKAFASWLLYFFVFCCFFFGLLLFYVFQYGGKHFLCSLSKYAFNKSTFWAYSIKSFNYILLTSCISLFMESIFWVGVVRGGLGSWVI